MPPQNPCPPPATRPVAANRLESWETAGRSNHALHPVGHLYRLLCNYRAVASAGKLIGDTDRGTLFSLCELLPESRRRCTRPVLPCVFTLGSPQGAAQEGLLGAFHRAERTHMPATAAFIQHRTRHLGQAWRCVHFAVFRAIGSSRLFQTLARNYGWC